MGERSRMKPSRGEVRRLVTALARKVYRARERNREADEATAGALKEIVELTEVLAARGLLDLSPAPVQKRKSADEIALQRLLKKAAESSLASVRIREQDEDTYDVTITTETRLHLTPQAAHLLAILATETGQDDGKVVGLKTRAEVAELLGTTKKAVATAVHRLRKALLQAGINPYLVETVRSLRAPHREVAALRFRQRTGEGDLFREGLASRGILGRAVTLATRRLRRRADADPPRGS